MPADGLTLFIYFVVCWIAFWATAGGLACRAMKRPVWRGILLGGILAPIGVLLALVTSEEKKSTKNEEQGATTERTISSSLANEQHRAGGVGQHFVARATDEQSFEHPAAPSSHHNQVDLPRGDEL